MCVCVCVSLFLTLLCMACMSAVFLFFCMPFRFRLGDNAIGDTGVAHVLRALKPNAAITSIRCGVRVSVNV